MYQVKLQEFEGPLDLLLKLFKEDKLEINKISLAKIADEYLKEITKDDFHSIPPAELADFLVVAAELLFLKSKILLPYWFDEEEEESNLEERLKQYREYLDLAFTLQKRVRARQLSWLREGLPKGVEQFIKEKFIFILKQPIVPSDLASLFQQLIVHIEKIQVKLPQEAIKRVVSLETKITALKEFLEHTHSLHFGEFVSKSSSKLDIVVAFLAVLELVKQRYLSVEQHELWGEIIVKKSVGYDQSKN